MRLADLNGQLLPSAEEARLLAFDCPCGCPCGICISFTPALDGSVVPDGRHPWQRVSGSTLEDITLSPSILIYPSPANGCKGWHGYVQNGSVTT